MNKTKYVFVGQNASTGTPNKITGRVSKYGKFYKFENHKLAKKFVDELPFDYNNQIIEIGTIRTLRKYDLGNTLYVYEDNLNTMCFYNFDSVWN